MCVCAAINLDSTIHSQASQLKKIFFNSMRQITEAKIVIDLLSLLYFAKTPIFLFSKLFESGKLILSHFSDDNTLNSLTNIEISKLNTI